VRSCASCYSKHSSSYSWEYPNKQGIGCNVISPQDSINFLQFLQELRQDSIGRNQYLSAAVGITPFMGPDGTPMTDVSAFAKQLDHIGALFTSNSQRMLMTSQES